ncbi:hypothetical protein G5S37_14000 [Roseimicrobium sp. ORNL1]|nr:hypothetical protein G5S37_14000 [Roseimicrobium sp. ORNL1]
MVAVFLTCCFLSGCRHVASPQADDLDAFIAAGFDDVTVYAIDSSRPIHPASMEVGDYAQWISQVDSTHFHRFPIRKQIVVTDQAAGRNLASAASAGMRQWAAGAKCFEPHHGLRVRKGDTCFDLVICYSCDHVEVWSASDRGKIVTTSDKSQSALDAVLKRAKP